MYVETILIVFPLLINVLEVTVKSDATEYMVCLLSDIELCIENKSDTTGELSKASEEGAGRKRPGLTTSRSAPANPSQRFKPLLTTGRSGQS